MTRIVIADDHPLFRQGLVSLLRSVILPPAAGNIDIAGEAGDGHEALKLIMEMKPEVAILDMEMPGTDGIEVTKQIHQKGLGTKVVLVTMHKDLSVAYRALKSGVSGYVLKDNTFEDLLFALRTVVLGGKFISPSIAEEVLKTPQVEPEGCGLLTPREREILKWIASGCSNKQIAAKLFISVKTVETHRARIMQKLDLHTTADLVRYAIQSGLVETKSI